MPSRISLQGGSGLLTSLRPGHPHRLPGFSDLRHFKPKNRARISRPRENWRQKTPRVASDVVEKTGCFRPLRFPPEPKGATPTMAAWPSKSTVGRVAARNGPPLASPPFSNPPKSGSGAVSLPHPVDPSFLATPANAVKNKFRPALHGRTGRRFFCDSQSGPSPTRRGLGAWVSLRRITANPGVGFRRTRPGPATPPKARWAMCKSLLKPLGLGYISGNPLFSGMVRTCGDLRTERDGIRRQKPDYR